MVFDPLLGFHSQSGLLVALRAKEKNIFKGGLKFTQRTLQSFLRIKSLVLFSTGDIGKILSGTGFQEMRASLVLAASIISTPGTCLLSSGCVEFTWDHRYCSSGTLVHSKKQLVSLYNNRKFSFLYEV